MTPPAPPEGGVLQPPNPPNLSGGFSPPPPPPGERVVGWFLWVVRRPKKSNPRGVVIPRVAFVRACSPTHEASKTNANLLGAWVRVGFLGGIESSRLTHVYCITTPGTCQALFRKKVRASGPLAPKPHQRECFRPFNYPCRDMPFGRARHLQNESFV